MNIGMTILGYKVAAIANGYAIAKSPFASSPYAVWKINSDDSIDDVRNFCDCEEAEWDFCARAFE